MVSAGIGQKGRLQQFLPAAGVESLVGIVICLLAALLVCFSIYRQTPPAALPADAPLAEYASGRAMRHLEVIARKPHPLGSREHAVVRDYILQELAAAGLRPEVQRTTAVNADEIIRIYAGSVENVVARLPGTANTKAVLLVGHYDSVPNGPGANDDGAAVATMLETLRALKAGAPLKNDVIFLFTDGEEAGLLGAHAFVAEHPLAKEVGLVLNFDARGSGGPVIMFETSRQNGWLIREFAKAIPYPVAHSLAYEIYKNLPNDTDLTVFKRAQFSGLNFAYISGLPRYHTQLDSVSEVDARTLQHQGSTALALTRHFGDLSLQDTKESNAVYFDILGLTLFHYSYAWVGPLSITVTVLFIGLVIIGLKKGRLTLSGMTLGFLAFLSSLIIAPVCVSLVWSFVQVLQDVPGVRRQGEAYSSNLYLLSFVACTIAITSALYTSYRRRISGENLTVGVLIWWVILLILSAVFVPGASYLLTWPLLFVLPGLLYMVAGKARSANSPGPLLLFSAGSALGIIMLAPTIYQTFVGLTLNSIGVVMVMVVLLLGLLVPHLNVIAASGKWLLPGASALAGLILLVAVGLTSRYDAQHPLQDTILYGLNADTGGAIWASSDVKPDPWTRQFFSAEVRKQPLVDVFSKFSSRQFLQSSAPPEPLNAPHIELLEDGTRDGVRALRMRVTSSRQATGLSIYLDSPAEVLGSSVNGKRTPAQPASPAGGNKNQWDLHYYALPEEGIEVGMEIRSEQPIRLRVVDQTYGLPEALGNTLKARPASAIPGPLPFNDSTFVSKSFTF